MEEKYLRRLRYLLNICAINNLGEIAEALIADCTRNLDNDLYAKDFRQGWQRVLRAHRKSPNDYNRVSLMLSNSAKKLRCTRDGSGYLAEMDRESDIQWRKKVGDKTKVVHRDAHLPDDLVVRLFAEGIEEIEIRDLISGLVRKMAIDTLRGGMIAVVPPTT